MITKYTKEVVVMESYLYANIFQNLVKIKIVYILCIDFIS